MTSVYLLLKEGAVVYVGCSQSLNRRIRKHLKDKDFDSFVEVDRFRTREEALRNERILIKLFSKLSKAPILNVQQNDQFYNDMNECSAVRSVDSFLNKF